MDWIIKNPEGEGNALFLYEHLRRWLNYNDENILKSCKIGSCEKSFC